MSEGRSKPGNPFSRVRFPVRGTRVDLVLPDRRHLAELVPLLNDPTISRWTLHIPYPYQRQDGMNWIRKSAVQRRLGGSLSLLVTRRSDGRVLGGIGLFHLEPGGSSGEVGYWIARCFQGQGYAQDAVRAALTLGFGELKLHRIEARIFPGNARSRRLAERCGFRFEGRLRHEAWKNGAWWDTLLYSRLSSDRAPRPRRT